jgi:hypothetical protein
MENATSIVKAAFFTDPLPRTRRLIVALLRLRGNVFTESLPSNGCARQSINHLQFSGANGWIT